MKWKKGDKVQILRKDIKNLLVPYGIVNHQNGAYVYVTPVWCDYEVELYDNEIRRAKPVFTTYEKEREKQRKQTLKIVKECVDRYKHLDNCPVSEIKLDQTISDAVIYALWRKDSGWL